MRSDDQREADYAGVMPWDENLTETAETVLQRDYEGLTTELIGYLVSHDERSLLRCISFAIDPELQLSGRGSLCDPLREFAEAHGWKLALRAVADSLPSKVK